MNINLTLLGQMITFILFVWFTKQFVWPPLIKALKERQAKIAEGIAAGEKGQLDLIRAQEQAALLLKQNRDEAADIILEAKKQADSIVDIARQQAHEEGQRIIVQAHSELDHLIEQAKETLRKQVAGLVLAGAEKVLEQSMDAKTHTAMLEKLAEEI